MISEVKASLRILRDVKAPGLDNIPAELLKYGSAALAEYLTAAIRNAWNNEVLHHEWKEGVVITIPKKGDLSICKNCT